MRIDWSALAVVAAVTLGSAVLLVGVIALAIRAFAASSDRVAAGHDGGAARAAGVACLVLAAAAVLFGLYLIVPQFH